MMWVIIPKGVKFIDFYSTAHWDKRFCAEVDLGAYDSFACRADGPAPSDSERAVGWRFSCMGGYKEGDILRIRQEFRKIFETGNSGVVGTGNWFKVRLIRSIPETGASYCEVIGRMPEIDYEHTAELVRANEAAQEILRLKGETSEQQDIDAE